MQFSRKDRVCFALQKKMDLAFTVIWHFYGITKSSHHSEKSSKTTMLKGNIWSRVGGLSPLRKICSLFPLTLREVKWKVSQQLWDPSWQSLGPLGVFWSSHTSPCCGWRPVTRRVLVLGQNLWSGLWYVTVSDGGIHNAFSLPDTQETSETQKKEITSEFLVPAYQNDPIQKYFHVINLSPSLFLSLKSEWANHLNYTNLLYITCFYTSFSCWWMPPFHE